MLPDPSVHAPPPRLGQVLRIALPAWVATVMFLLWTVGPQVVHNLGDPDDAARLQQVRDLLFGGQGWYDLVQHRFNPPEGVFIHYSRLIDLPIAGLILLFNAFASLDTAELWTRALWPTVPILPLVAAAGFIAGRFGGMRAALVAIVFACAACTMIGLLRPGRIDHHNAQLASTMVLFACLLVETRAAGLTAGLVAALMLSIGIETIPYTALACALVTLRWGLLGTAGPFMRWFFGSFAAAATVSFGLTVTPSLWGAPVCDMLSPLYLVPLVIGGAALVFLSGPLGSARWQRLTLVGVVALAVVASVALVNPVCLRGPYAAVDPLLITLWMNNVGEARSAQDVFHVDPGGALAVFALPVAAMLVGLLWLAVGARAWRSMPYGQLALVAVSFLVSLWQVRAVSFDTVFAIPILAVALARATAVPIVPRRRALALVLICLLVNPFTLPLSGLAVGNVIAAPSLPSPMAGSLDRCLEPHDYDVLAGLPAGLVAAPVDIGSFILATTRHTVLAGPYHPDRTGILDVYAMLTGSDANAHRVVLRRGVDYLVYCAQSATPAEWATGGADGLEGRLDRGEVPSWLHRLAPSAPGPLRIYRVLGSQSLL